MWEELGFYEGFARTWRAAYIARGGEADACVPFPLSGLGSIFFLSVFDESVGSGGRWDTSSTCWI
jgi:hypothetical protein